MSSRRAPALLAAGSVVSGLLAYLVFVLVTRALGATAAAPVSVLWTAWALAGAALTFPLQHWITRCVAAGREGDVGRSAGGVATVVVLVSVTAGVLSWLLRERLFGRDDGWFPVLVALVFGGSACVGVLRGGLAGRGRMGAAAWSLVAENALRCVLVGVLLLAGVHDPVAHGLALVAGSLVALWPAAWRLHAADDEAGRAGSLAFLGGAATAQLFAQGVLTGGAVVVALVGGSPAEVTVMFATLALFRAPYMVVLGTLPQLTHHVTGLVAAEDRQALRALAGRLAVLAVATVAIGAVVGLVAGSPLVRAVFGRSVEVGPGVATLVAAGCALALVNVVLMVVALALERPGRVSGAWCLAVVAGALVLLTTGAAAPLERVAVAFLAAEVVATALLAVVASGALRPGRRTSA
ncbi:lipopolysaccharide biosynthesis protein [Nocardioides sp. zg-1228]|uniref:lipopolysaccharide biosynthesis protein n=1 Tax=Nocardioides sp. zg-1228 TaxID=2763008 RepID=UPI001642682B|nr:oligosaccharide flippase family protein [Nocardioides sp. zg-1228]MBC2934259.1 oligosaccharide flippase family protein [Nocardioides sp. zg-1228]QSF59039.1 oligosaccharide flippase family protein [Nocardioides sp. zg-1228]